MDSFPPRNRCPVVTKHQRCIPKTASTAGHWPWWTAQLPSQTPVKGSQAEKALRRCTRYSRAGLEAVPLPVNRSTLQGHSRAEHLNASSASARTIIPFMIFVNVSCRRTLLFWTALEWITED